MTQQLETETDEEININILRLLLRTDENILVRISRMKKDEECFRRSNFMGVT